MSVEYYKRVIKDMKDVKTPAIANLENGFHVSKEGYRGNFYVVLHSYTGAFRVLGEFVSHDKKAERSKGERHIKMEGAFGKESSTDFIYKKLIGEGAEALEVNIIAEVRSNSEEHVDDIFTFASELMEEEEKKNKQKE